MAHTNLTELTPFEYFTTDGYNIHMNTYIFEYRTKNWKPLLVSVEAMSKKDATEKALSRMKKGEYLVEKPKRCFTGTQGNLLKKDI